VRRREKNGAKFKFDFLRRKKRNGTPLHLWHVRAQFNYFGDKKHIYKHKKNCLTSVIMYCRRRIPFIFVCDCELSFLKIDFYFKYLKFCSFEDYMMYID
jgi:hypothetical protein